MILTEIETRVLGSLIEKDITTPDYYPLSLNALVNACNQKNNRDPVMTLDESAVRDALANSLNVATVKVAELIGYGRVVQIARQMGLGNNIQATPAVAQISRISRAHCSFILIAFRPL